MNILIDQHKNVYVKLESDLAVKPVIKMGHPTLRKMAAELTESEVKSGWFKNLISDMRDTMKHEGGIGIAAPQIDESYQVCIVSIPEDSSRYPDSEKSEEYIVVNPVITVLDEDKMGNWEGCLSVPGLRGYVERPRKVQIQFRDENFEEVEIIVDDFLAIVFQHELDHLFGKLYIDRITDTKMLSYNEEFVQFHLEE